jgi:ankyrin repeat protein
MASLSSAPDPRARFALRRAVRNGSTDQVRALLDSGSDPNEPAGPVSTLALAAEIGSAETVELLIDHGADPSWLSRAGWSAATYADANDFAVLAERLVELGAPAASRRAHGYSDLHRAARRGDVDSVLVGLGPEAVDTVDSSGATPLALAISFRHEAAVDALLRAGADPDYSRDDWSVLNSRDDWSVLNDAVYQDSRPGEPTHLAERLLAAGANLNPPGYPPLFCTVNQEWSSGSVLRQLVAAGADIAAIGGWERQTVLHRIAEIADADLVDAALDLGADIEARDGQGRTPLLASAITANSETFTRLVERGADVSAQDVDGQSVEDLLESSTGADKIRRVLDQLRSHDMENRTVDP